VSDFLVPKIPQSAFAPINRFYVPTLTTVGNESYLINKVLCYTKKIISGDTTPSAQYYLIDTTVDFIQLGVSVGDIVLNLVTYKSSTVADVQGISSLYLNDNIFSDVDIEPYAIYSVSKFSEAEKVTSGKISMLASSMLTAPSLMFPAYTQTYDYITMYPTSIVGYGAVQATYFRYPKPPKWTYVTLSGGEPSFDQSQSDYQDFELPQEDEYKLAVKILEYCGISIRENEVTQFAMAQEQHEQPSFSMKQ
jgi:hypothetical protein